MTSVPPETSSLRVLSLISAGHFCSHFYYMVLPPLFPILLDVYGVGFTELGLALMVFSLSNALTAAPIGVLVDRFSPCTILVTGLIIEGLVFCVLGLFPNYAALLVLMAIAGACNSVFHPANYTILDGRVSDKKMGRAFSIHSFGGYLGAAVAPIVVVGVAAMTNWQIAVSVTGVGGLVIAGILILNRAHLRTDKPFVPKSNDPVKSRNSGSLQILWSAPILLGLVFFALLAIAEYGISDFGVSSLHLMYGVPLTTATVGLSVYLFGGPIGVLAGGWLADRFHRHDLVVAVCMLMFSVCVIVIAAVDPSWSMVLVLLAAAGFTAGLVAPSRDLIIRSVTPSGDIGKVFGFVAMGLTIGGVVSRPLYGFQLDHMDPLWLFAAAGLFGIMASVVALLTTSAAATRLVRSEAP